MYQASAPAAPDRIVGCRTATISEKQRAAFMEPWHRQLRPHQALHRRRGWFWDAALNDLGVLWDKPAAVLGESRGSRGRALVRGRKTASCGCLDRHAAETAPHRRLEWVAEAAARFPRGLDRQVCQVAAPAGRGVAAATPSFYMPMVPSS
jgi:hypothetical protein